MISEMRSRIQGVVLPSEPAEFRDELRRMLEELERSIGDEALTGECAPALDVFETDEAVEIAMDLPGVPPSAVRVAAQGQTILIAGHKAPRRTRPESSFHLVERGYGHFARAIHISTACDTSRARATLTNGELRITVPRIVERRGRPIRVTVAGETPSA
jgi:HSP20 family protein